MQCISLTKKINDISREIFLPGYLYNQTHKIIKVFQWALDKKMFYVEDIHNTISNLCNNTHYY